MNRTPIILNLVGVIALAGLCGIQWRNEQQSETTIDALLLTRVQQSAKIVEQTMQITGQKTDLEDFRQRLMLSELQLKDMENKLNVLISQRNALNVECDQLKISIQRWTAAVADRDAALKQAGEQILKLGTERNDSITKFNDLAEKYNAVMKICSK